MHPQDQSAWGKLVDVVSLVVVLLAAKWGLVEKSIVGAILVAFFLGRGHVGAVKAMMGVSGGPGSSGPSSGSSQRIPQQQVQETPPRDPSSFVKRVGVVLAGSGIATTIAAVWFGLRRGGISTKLGALACVVGFTSG